MNSATSTALHTDKYELTMLQAALNDGTASRACTFEVFGRKLPGERRYGVVAGTARVVDAVMRFRFTEDQLASLDFLEDNALEFLRNYRFTGTIEGYREGDVYFPYSPILTVHGTFAECVILETIILSILNADSAVATAAARMVSAADGRPVIEMGSRRTHEAAAVTATRAAYLGGFSATSNLEAARRYSIPASGTAAHAWTLLHVDADGRVDEAAAFRSQIESLGVDTTLLVDTFDVQRAVQTAIEVAGTQLGGVRLDSGDLGHMTRRVRAQLDELGAYNTKIIVSNDLNEFSIAALRSSPVDAFGLGTAVVTGSGTPTQGLVYKLVEVDGVPVAKRSSGKKMRGGAKRALRTFRDSGTAVEEIIYLTKDGAPRVGKLDSEELTVPLIKDGEALPLPSLEESRDLLARRLVSLPWEGLSLSPGDPVLTATYVGFD